MLDPKELRLVVDTAKRELEKAMLFPTDSKVVRFRQRLAQDIGKALPACFPETIQTIIPRSVQPALREIISPLVSEGVEQAIRPLAEEVAPLRRFIEGDSESDNWWRHGPGPDQDPDPQDREAT